MPMLQERPNETDSGTAKSVGGCFKSSSDHTGCVEYLMKEDMFSLYLFVMLTLFQPASETVYSCWAKCRDINNTVCYCYCEVALTITCAAIFSCFPDSRWPHDRFTTYITLLTIPIDAGLVLSVICSAA